VQIPVNHRKRQGQSEYDLWQFSESRTGIREICLWISPDSQLLFFCRLPNKGSVPVYVSRCGERVGVKISYRILNMLGEFTLGILNTLPCNL